MFIKQEINRITSEYFEDNLDYQKLCAASKELKYILNEISGLEMDDEDGRADIQFHDGKALGTFWAAQCLDDLIRTRQFLRGIDKAIKEKIKKNVPLHILYAGTGPFATLILPFILRYSKHELKYTLLEINPLSIKILGRIISKLGLEEYNIKLLKEDATKYQIGNEIPDIIISETMQNALAKEQQVSIFHNLMSQVKFSSLFIPEKIEIFIGLRMTGIPIEELQKEHYHKEKKIFELSKEAIGKVIKITHFSREELTFPRIQTVIEKERVNGFNQIVLITEIQVYKDEKIQINDSGLTTPITIINVSDCHKDTIIVNTQYKLSNEPKLEFEIASPNPI